MTTTCDGRNGVEPTWLTSYRKVKQKNVHLRDVSQRCIRQGMAHIGTMLVADLLRNDRSSTVGEQLNVRLALGIDPHHALGAAQFHVRCKGSHD